MTDQVTAARVSAAERRQKEREKRLAELRAQRQRILDLAAPIRAERDALVAEYQPRERALREKLRTAEAGLYDIDVEIAEIVRLSK